MENVTTSKNMTCPLYVLDKTTSIKKLSFIIPCKNCAVYITKNHKKCKDKGCQFQRQYNSMNPELPMQQKLRLMKIYMDGYYKLSR